MEKVNRIFYARGIFYVNGWAQKDISGLIMKWKKFYEYNDALDELFDRLDRAKLNTYYNLCMRYIRFFGGNERIKTISGLNLFLQLHHDLKPSYIRQFENYFDNYKFEYRSNLGNAYIDGIMTIGTLIRDEEHLWLIEEAEKHAEKLNEIQCEADILQARIISDPKLMNQDSPNLMQPFSEFGPANKNKILRALQQNTKKKVNRRAQRQW